MKSLVFLMLAGIASSVCYQIIEKNNPQIERLSKTSLRGADETLPQGLLKLTDAEKIMGEPVHLADSSTNYEQGITSYRCGYKANAVAGDRPGAVYFLFQHYD